MERSACRVVGENTYLSWLLVVKKKEEEASSEDGICGDRFGFGFGCSRELLASSMSDSSLAREYIKTRATAYRVSIFLYFTTYSSSSLRDFVPRLYITRLTNRHVRQGVWRQVPPGLDGSFPASTGCSHARTQLTVLLCRQ